MKLATSTWVKIALIGLLCLGVCGWLGGCGRGGWFASSPLWPGGVLGCAGINAVDGPAWPSLATTKPLPREPASRQMPPR